MSCIKKHEIICINECEFITIGVIYTSHNMLCPTYYFYSYNYLIIGDDNKHHLYNKSNFLTYDQWIYEERNRKLIELFTS